MILYACYTIETMAGKTYPQILIIFNPNSTSGSAAARAKKLSQRLHRRGLKDVVLVETEYAGHAELIAYDATVKYKQPLIISVSGDGGYNEVINGALRAQDEDNSRQPVCAILAAGNANDHRRSVRKRFLTYAITKTPPEAIDVLALTSTTAGVSTVRYAHSYIGFGISSEGAARINAGRYNRLQELLVGIRTLIYYPYFRIIDHNGVARRLDFLVFANIHQMAKYIKLHNKSNLHNGLFRVVAIPHTNRLKRLLMTFRFVTIGYKNSQQDSAYEFQLVKTETAQFDGEVTTLPGGAHIKVEAIQEKLFTLR